MHSALIGFSGFVGSNIARKARFTDYYNSKNINSIKGKKYNLIVSAGTGSLKWKANLEPQKDWATINALLTPLKDVRADYFVLISTVDVYPKPFYVDEEISIDPSDFKEGYGRNRYGMENFIKDRFKKYTLVRMPQTFGIGIKKNFVYDLIYNNALHLTHKESVFQWYSLENLWSDITIGMKNNLPIINLAVEPITAWEAAKYTVNMDFTTVTKKEPVRYNMLTKYGKLYESKDSYLYNKLETLKNLKDFILSERRK